MRIVHLTQSLDPATGGLPVVPVRLAAAQARLGHYVTIMAERDAAADHDPPILFRNVPGIDRVGLHWLPRAGSRLAMFGRGPAWPVLRSSLDGADILHAHGMWESIVFVACKVAQEKRIPYLLAPHGMLDPWSMSQKRFKKRLGLLLGWRSLLNRSAAIHALNLDEKQLLDSLKLTARVEIIPNGIFLDEVDPLPPASEFPASRPYVLFLSRLHFKKGLDILAEAFARLAAHRPDVDLVVAGPDGGAQADFERRIAEKGLQARVLLPGPLHGRQKWAALSGAAAFCLPSRQEGFSMAILEALAARLPVVISEACHFPEVAEVGAGCVVSLDAEAVAQGLSTVLNREAAASMGSAGRTLVEDRFTWPRAAACSLEVYERLRR